MIVPEENVIAVSDLSTLRERILGQEIVLATGCFDIVHVGHLFFLREAWAQADVLVVGLNSDRAVKVIKGADRPVVGQDDRVQLVAAFRYVDYVFIFDDVVANDCILKLRPDVFAIGEESLTAYPSEATAAIQVGARVHVIHRVPSLSTTSIIRALDR